MHFEDIQGKQGRILFLSSTDPLSSQKTNVNQDRIKSLIQMFCCSSEEEEPEKVKPSKGEDVPKGQRSKHIHAEHKAYIIKVALNDQICAVRYR